MAILKTWFEKENFYKQYELGFYECDFNKEIKLSTILAMASDTAGNDYTDRGISHKKMMDAKQVMLLARYHVHIDRLPVVDELLTVKTYENGVVGGYAIREFEIIDETQRPCILLSSSWVIVNPDNKRIIRPKNFICKEFNPVHNESLCEICDKICIDDSDPVYCTNHIVEYSDLDGNGHMNNANYGNLIYNTLCKIDSKSNFNDIFINYVKEAKVNDEIKMYVYKKDNILYIKGIIEDNICFLCKII